MSAEVKREMKRNIMIAVYSAAHFFVDLACAFLMFRCIFPGSGRGEVILFYNFCAFALQMPLGALMDRLGMGHLAAAAGCLMIAAAYPLNTLAGGLTAAIVMGLGNSLFHLGGGVYVLDEFDKSGALGVFVSPGAIGLYLGTLWGSGDTLPITFPIAAVTVCGMIIFLLPRLLRLENVRGAAAPVLPVDGNFSGNASACLSAAAMFTLVVVIRSFGGFALHPAWKTGMAAFAAVIATASGKAAGGFLSDKLGKEIVSAVTMAAAGLLFLFSDNMAAGLSGIFLFNMSMPITLRAAADIFRDSRGFSFGLLTFALFLGYIPVYIFGNPAITGSAMCLLCLASGILLTAGFRAASWKRRPEGECAD